MDHLRRAVVFIRLLAAPLAAVLVGFSDLPDGYAPWAWAAVAVLAAGALAFFALDRRPLAARVRTWVDVAALAFDFAIVFAFVILFAFRPGQPLLAFVFLVVVEAALRFGLRGGIAAGLAGAPLLTVSEVLRVVRFDFMLQPDAVVIRTTLAVVIGAMVGRLTEDLLRESERSARRAEEAERLRDRLGRRVDLLEAANRCARALGSSLELDEAFGAFIRELRALVPFDRVAVVLADDGAARVMAVAGRGEDELFTAGSTRPVSGSVLEEVLRGQVVYRADLRDGRYPEEQPLLELGLGCRVAAPLLLGTRAIGMLSLMRAEPHSFSDEELELASLLGRLVATAAQNIRAYETERSTVHELRRLSALRADFVSLVSHELRSPMAAVIGSARTLQQRWRELSPEHREAFLALIADETTRLASLVGDVLDTSRIDAGTFAYSFAEVEIGGLLREVAASAELGQDEVRVSVSVREPLPVVRGDGERLRQVLLNLIENGVKHSPAGAEVRATARAEDDQVIVEVTDEGKGIPPEHHELIFEKFGRAPSAGSTPPGSGLGLYIARSIAEAHGGSVTVRSSLGRGSTFTLTLPAERADRARADQAA